MIYGTIGPCDPVTQMCNLGHMALMHTWAHSSLSLSLSHAHTHAHAHTYYGNVLIENNHHSVASFCDSRFTKIGPSIFGG